MLPTRAAAAGRARAALWCTAAAALVLTHSVLQAGPFDQASDDTSEGLYWTAGAAWSTCPTTLGFVSSPKTGSTTVAGALAELIGGEAMPNADGSLQLLNGGGEGPFATNIFEHGRAAWADQTRDVSANLLTPLDSCLADPAAQTWIDEVGREAWDAALTITVARSPWSRAVSFFEQTISMFCIPDPLGLSCVVSLEEGTAIPGAASDPLVSSRPLSALPPLRAPA